MNSEIIGVGELLWDMLPSGPKMGGAPANFACHANSLGGSAVVISRVGNDDMGRKIVRTLANADVSTAGISADQKHPTGQVDVTIGEDGQPEYVIQQNAAWDHLKSSPTLLEMASRCSAICFGTLGQRSTASHGAIKEIVKASRPGALRVFDVNLRQEYFSAELIHESLLTANVMKLNDDELRVIPPLLGIEETSPRAQLSTLLERYDLRMIACTRGARGSLLHDGTTWSEHPGTKTAVIDTIGAGDAFTAALTMGLLKGWPLDQISEAANLIAAHVCSCTGATPPMPVHLKNLFLAAEMPS